MTESFVAYDKPFDGVASITLNRPGALNAINMAMARRSLDVCSGRVD